MKQFIHKTIIAVCLLTVTVIPLKNTAQCLCEEGVIPDSVVQTQYHDSITAINTNIVFAQFDPTIGTLSCMNLSSTLTTVLTFDLFNQENFPDTYLLESFRRSRFSGPSGFVSSVTSPAKEYGPYDLGPADPSGTGDEMHIGPDTVFNGATTSTNHSGSAFYIGTGTITFDYLNTSTTTLLDGSSNLDLFVRGYSRLNVRLVYYWCPSTILASNIKNFLAVKKDKTIQLGWKVDNEESTNTYEILVSSDGRTFTSIGRTAATEIAGDASAAYNFQYPLNQAKGGKLYFRIRQKDASGKAAYSAIRTVNLDDLAAGSFGIYPNPVKRKMSLQFDRELKGNYKIEMINTVGQVVYSRRVYLDNQPVIPIELANSPAPGVYYVRVRSTETNQLYTNKLLIQR